MSKKGKIYLFFSIILLSLLYAYLIKSSISAKLPEEKALPIFYSNQCRQDLKNTILKAIESSKESVYMIMFGLTDIEIIELLEKKAKEGIKIDIFYDKRSSKKIAFDFANCIGIKKSGLLHQKILVIDEKIVFLGSTNFTKSSFAMHNNLLIGVRSKNLAEFLIKKTPYKIGHFKNKFKHQPFEIWLLPDRKNIALEKIVQTIRKTKKSIKIAMFTFTHPILIDELIKAKKRHINISVVIDRVSSYGASHKYIQKLKDNNIRVYIKDGPELMHHKYFLSDNYTLITGSTNWTKAGFKKNSDIFIKLDKLSPKQTKFINKLHDILEKESQ